MNLNLNLDTTVHLRDVQLIFIFKQSQLRQYVVT